MQRRSNAGGTFATGGKAKAKARASRNTVSAITPR
jgi:hypothetical protein